MAIVDAMAKHVVRDLLHLMTTKVTIAGTIGVTEIKLINASHHVPTVKPSRETKTPAIEHGAIGWQT